MLKQAAMITLGLLTCLSATSARAGECVKWKNEINPATQKRYASESEWKEDVASWSKSMPGVPGFWDLIEGMSAGTQASKKAKDYPERLKTDKQMHCYVGCRIAKATNARTATFAAWYKEVKDITDCKIGSHFDPADLEATVFGAQIGDRDGKCVAECSDMADILAEEQNP